LFQGEDRKLFSIDIGEQKMSIFGGTSDLGWWERIKLMIKSLPDVLKQVVGIDNSSTTDAFAGALASVGIAVNELTLQVTYLTYLILAVIGVLVIRWMIRRFI